MKIILKNVSSYLTKSTLDRHDENQQINAPYGNNLCLVRASQETHGCWKRELAMSSGGLANFWSGNSTRAIPYPTVFIIWRVWVLQENC
jgi:hypothetical protein